MVLIMLYIHASAYLLLIYFVIVCSFACLLLNFCFIFFFYLSIFVILNYYFFFLFFFFFFQAEDGIRDVAVTGVQTCALPIFTDGFPTVNVPVLSKTIVLTLFAISICSPPLYNIPFSAPFPAPIINAAGVAIPNAQGQAMIITDTNASIE